MRRIGAVAVAATAMVLAAATLSGCGSAQPTTQASVAITNAASHAPTTINVWSFVNLPNEVKSMQDSMTRLEAKYPWLHVNLVNNKADTDFTQAVTAGNAPDVYISWDPGSVAQFCYQGSVIDMTALAKSANLDVTSTFPAAALQATQWDGKQCALPLLVDAYGIYYNKDMFAKAGITTMPKTLSEFTADIKKLTIKNPDGTIKQWGITPPRVDYDVGTSWFTGGATGAQFYDANGDSTFSTDPTWAELLNWQKSILDYFGTANVNKFVATYSNHTDDAKNPFVSGASAMEMNGEWHIGEIDSENPKLNYGIIPVPVPDSKASVYGAGTVMGNVIYISSQSPNQAAAFFVAQQLATDTTFLDDFATQMSNVPTTFDALKNWSAPAKQPLWNVMEGIVSNPNSYNKTMTPAGEADSTAWQNFITNWQSGKVPDLQAGLKNLDQQIKTMNQQATQ